MRYAVIERRTCRGALRRPGSMRECGTAKCTMRRGIRVAPLSHGMQAAGESSAPQAFQSGRSPVASSAGSFGSAALRRGSCFASAVVMARLSLPTAP